MYEKYTKHFMPFTCSRLKYKCLLESECNNFSLMFVVAVVVVV